MAAPSAVRGLSNEVPRVSRIVARLEAYWSDIKVGNGPLALDRPGRVRKGPLRSLEERPPDAPARIWGWGSDPPKAAPPRVEELQMGGGVPRDTLKRRTSRAGIAYLNSRGGIYAAMEYDPRHDMPT